MTKKQKKEMTQKIEKYINFTYDAEDDVPTIAGLCVYLDITKEEFSLWENNDKVLSKAVKKAKNQIEHFFISRSALKRINNTTAHFYLNNAFNYSKGRESTAESGDFALKITVDENN